MSINYSKFKKVLSLFFSVFLVASCMSKTNGSNPASAFDGEKGDRGTCGDYTEFVTPDSCQQLNELEADEIVLGRSRAAGNTYEHLGKKDGDGRTTAKSGHICVLKQKNPKLRLRLDVVGWFDGIASDPGYAENNYRDGFFMAFNREEGIKPTKSYGEGAILFRAATGNRIYCQCAFGPQGVSSCADFN